MFPGSDELAGLWLLPAFINHSCIANVTRSFRVVEKVVFFELRAATDLEPDTELVHSYIAGTRPLWTRDGELQRRFGFGCTDDRANLEKLCLDAGGLKDECEEWLSASMQLVAAGGKGLLKGFRKLRQKVEKKLKKAVEEAQGKKLLHECD